jgi:predicted nucleic acid-binding protein
VLFDTTFLIDLQREVLRRSPGKAFRFLAAHGEEPVRVSIVTYGEMAEGFLPPAREDFLELMQPYLVVYPTEGTAWRYGQMSRLLRESGTPIGDNDLWIACTAQELDAELVTRDRRHFDRIPGLRVITY